MCGWFLLCVSLLLVVLLFPLLSVLCPEPLLPCGQRQAANHALPPNEECCPLTIYTPPTGYEPKLLNDFHYSETAEIIFQEQSNLTMRPSEKRSLHHCSFRSEKNQRTEDKLITLLKKVCCQLSPYLCVTQERGDPCTNLVRANKIIKSRNGKRKKQDSPWKTKRATSRWFYSEIQKHEFQAHSDRRSTQELTGIIESQRLDIEHTLACDERLRRDQPLVNEQLSEQNRDLREPHMKS